jgi:hypothetical protein
LSPAKGQIASRRHADFAISLSKWQDALGITANRLFLLKMVARGGIEPPTRGFSEFVPE